MRGDEAVDLGVQDFRGHARGLRGDETVTFVLLRQGGGIEARGGRRGLGGEGKYEKAVNQPLNLFICLILCAPRA